MLRRSIQPRGTITPHQRHSKAATQPSRSAVVNIRKQTSQEATSRRNRGREHSRTDERRYSANGWRSHTRTV